MSIRFLWPASVEIGERRWRRKRTRTRAFWLGLAENIRPTVVFTESYRELGAFCAARFSLFLREKRVFWYVMFFLLPAQEETVYFSLRERKGTKRSARACRSTAL